MQLQRKFEGKIPKIKNKTQNNHQFIVKEATTTGTKPTIKTTTITSQGIATMLPAATTLNGIPQHPQQHASPQPLASPQHTAPTTTTAQYINLQSGNCSTTTSTANLDSASVYQIKSENLDNNVYQLKNDRLEDNVYQLKGEIVCDSSSYQQQQQQQQHNHSINRLQDFFKTPLPPTTIKYHQQQLLQLHLQQKTQSQPLPLPISYCHAALTNPLFPTQSQNHTTTSSMPSPLYKNTPTLSLLQTPKIQNVQRASSNNNHLDWKSCNKGQELNYGPQMNNLSIKRHSFVNEYTKFVIKNCSVQTIKSCTKVDQYDSSKINRRSNSSSSNNSNNNQLNQLPSSSTIICNNRRKIKTNNNNSSNNKITNNLLNGKKLITSTATTPNVTTNAIINNCSSSNNNEIITLNSRNMQVLLKRCKSAAATTTPANNNNNNQFVTQTLTLPGRGIVLKQHNQPDTYVIEDQIEPEEDEEEPEQQKDEVEQPDDAAAMHLSRTAQILRKFRIPKTTALLPKMVAANNSSNNNKCLVNTDDLSCRNVLTVAAPTPPPTVGTPNSTASSGVGFLEEVIEGVDEDDMQDDTETVIIEESLPKSEIIDESDEYLTDENYLTEDGLMSNLDNVSGNTVIMSNNNAGSTAPLQLQTLQPNGAITCINLPPNTILLSAADGTILATTAPASNSNNKLQTGDQTSQQQQQQQQQRQRLIALQDWSGNGGNVGMLPQNGTTTMLLTSDGNAIPILRQSMAAAAAANELLKTQVLA